MSAPLFRSPCPVRPAVPEDETALGELDRATWSTLHAVQPRPQPPYGPFFDDRHPPREFLVADAVTGAGEVRPAGYIRLARPTPLACNAHVLQIQGLAVADWARRQGIARCCAPPSPRRDVGVRDGSPCACSATTPPPGRSTRRKDSPSRAYCPGSSSWADGTSTTC